MRAALWTNIRITLYFRNLDDVAHGKGERTTNVEPSRGVAGSAGCEEAPLLGLLPPRTTYELTPAWPIKVVNLPILLFCSLMTVYSIARAYSTAETC